MHVYRFSVLKSYSLCTLTPSSPQMSDNTEVNNSIDSSPLDQQDEEIAPSHRLYVWNLGYTLTNIDIKKVVFNETGLDCYARVSQTRSDANRSSGYATIAFDSIEDATKALAALNGLTLRGRSLGARFDRGPPASKRPVQDHSIFFYSLPYSITWRDVKDLVRTYADVESADVIMKKGRSTGTAVARCTSAAGALAAINGLNGVLLRGRRISVKPYEANYSSSNHSKQEVEPSENQFRNEDEEQYVFTKV